ncbi:histidine kinase dimerization/phosphoacceptor domain -containing protein [uncultured Tateyamaria sp.]|uniref:sensor histidine kinase n=1 Tax=uncultured Tateyamaria sp. TaxID=455651 RepID=UPI0026380616|nr:histidine kinase dimerization/phosphoacceptor domain -containing protein [uncultured Tateyamaria sp.]
MTSDTSSGDTAVTTGTSLTFRIGALLTLALLPLGVIAILQSWSAIDTARDTYRQSLAAQTLRAARPETEAITHAFGLALGLSNAIPALLADPAGCVAAMRNAVRQNPKFAFASFIEMDQTTTCNSADRRFDFSDNPANEQVFEARAADVTFNPSGSVSNQAVVIVSQPVRTRDGTFLGFVSLSFPTTPLAETRARADADPELTLITFDGQGEVLTTGGDRDAVAPLLPAEGGLTALVGGGQRVFSAVSVDGQRRDYTLAPIVPGRAYALGIWDVPRLNTGDLPLILRAASFPLLMWLASLMVAIMALRHQVIGPVRALRMRMRSFADGRAIFRANSIPNAPRELQEIGETFEQVADKVVRDEADLEEKVHERELLLREVHHRVKNNLQLMSSIINMQIRQDVGAEAEDALRRVQQRLSSLAKFHQDLYETSSLSKLRADQLLEDLARQNVNLNTDVHRQIDLRLDLDKVTLEPDQAGPLAMLVTEALTNAIKHASGAVDDPVFIAVSMKRTGGDTGRQICLRVENSLSRDASGPGESGLGTRLIQAFALQVGGSLRQDRDSDRYFVELVFDRL